MTITIADVAAAAGVSKTTVSRVLNGKDDLDAQTADRVRRVIADLGYVPSARAVGLARGRTRIVGMLVPSLTWPWMGEVLQGAVDAMEAAGYGLLLFTVNRGEDSMRQFAQQVSARAFDGLLVVEPDGQTGYIAELYEGGLPVVLIDDRAARRPRFPSVGTTNRRGARSAGEHLIALGRHRPLVITGKVKFGCTQERVAGFADAYAEAGLTIDPALIFEGDFSYGCGREAVLRSAGTGFDAVFAHNDLSATGAMQAVIESGRTVPGDVAVVGFDDLPLAANAQPPLSTVHQPLREMGDAAARLLLAHFAGEPLPANPVTIPTTFVTRESTTGR